MNAAPCTLRPAIAPLRGAIIDLQDVELERRADVVIDVVNVARQQWNRDHRRPRSLTAREALSAIQFEALLVWTAAANVRNNVVLSGEDMARLTLAMQRIDTVAKEVTE